MASLGDLVTGNIKVRGAKQSGGHRIGKKRVSQDRIN